MIIRGMGQHGLYHCVTRCVRRAWLCGVDPLTHVDHEQRKLMVEARIRELGSIFAVGNYAYAVMSNHLHVVIPVEPAGAADWTDEEVAGRLRHLFPVRDAERYAARKSMQSPQFLSRSPSSIGATGTLTTGDLSATGGAGSPHPAANRSAHADRSFTFEVRFVRVAALNSLKERNGMPGDCMRRWMLLVLWLLPVAALAQDCPNALNLVANCGFNTSIAGYTPQDPGDAIAYVSNVGATAPGAMRVSDTVADGNTDAEAETCINTGPGVYQLAASFKAIAADTCFVGFDEHVQPNCAAPNGIFVAGAAAAVNAQSFTRIQSLVTVGPAVVSVEMVVICAAGSTPAQFDVDDVAMFERALFKSGFE